MHKFLVRQTSYSLAFKSRGFTAFALRVSVKCFRGDFLKFSRLIAKIFILLG